MPTTVDLALDLDLDAPPPPARQPPAAAPAAAERPRPAPVEPEDNAPLEFDLGDLSLDLDTPPGAPMPGAGSPKDAGATNFADFTLDDGAAGGDAALSRKLDLAEEFIQIGDTDGARDLIEEVLSKATGALKTDAQALLDRLH
jgi:pilus assembly protein FimV